MVSTFHGLAPEHRVLRPAMLVRLIDTRGRRLSSLCFSADFTDYADYRSHCPGFHLEICVICGLLVKRSHARLKNLHIPRTPAEIARQAVANLGFVRTRILFQQVNRGQNHSRRANTALRAAAFDKGLLDAM